MKTIWIILLSLFAGALLGTMLMRSCQPEITTEVVRTDTLIMQRVDTIVVAQPKPYKVVVRDTIYINDTINNPINGTIFVQEIKEYKDSTYYARISGINAFLEEIKVYPKETIKYITTTEIVREKPPKWAIGLQGGYGITPKGLQPYIGVGVTYKIQF